MSGRETESRDRGMGTGTLIALMVAFVVVGMPLVYILWSTLNELLAGRVDGAQLLIAIPVLALFLGLLAILAKSIRSWERRLH